MEGGGKFSSSSNNASANNFSRRSSSTRKGQRRSRIPKTLFFSNSNDSNNGNPNQKYYTRRHSSTISTNDLPLELNAIGFYSLWGFFWMSLFSVVPLAYFYILLMLLRDLCLYFPETVYEPLLYYTPYLAYLADYMKNETRRIVDVWCVIEALFFIGCKLKVQYLQSKDPLEASLSAAPMLDSEDRRNLWDRMMDVEKDDPCSFISGWFFDQPIHSISRYDVNNFLCWSMFDGRNQEHLTTQELQDLEHMVEDLEYRISLNLYGPMKTTTTTTSAVVGDENNVTTAVGGDENNSEAAAAANDDDDAEGNNINDDDDDNNNKKNTTLNNSQQMLHAQTDDHTQDTMTTPLSPIRPRSTLAATRDDDVTSNKEEDDTISSTSESFFSRTSRRVRPIKSFRFSTDTQSEEPNFFSNLFESYRRRYDRYKSMVENADFHPVQDVKESAMAVRQKIAETAHQAEEQAMATAHQMYETIIQPGSNMDKQISGLSNATSAQLTEAWNSVRGIQGRLSEAVTLSEQRKKLMEQLRGNRAMLTRMREMSYAVPSKQMAALMRKITEGYDALERIESRARDGFVHATGVLADRGNALLFQRKEPQRFARYSSDPLLGIATYPLGFHLLVLGASEIAVRILMRRRGFEKRSVGPVEYYYHPGNPYNNDDVDNEEDDDDDEPPHHGINFFNFNEEDKTPNKVPIIFVHGIGIGIISYINLLDEFLKSGRPIFVPEIPYVMGFRFYISPNNVLSPAVVASTMTAMLATHGYSKGVFVGHSFGTSWLSYVCKYAPSSVSALLFLDPICFCLHGARLTKNWVYHRPDPGTISFMVKTDMMINWTIQRAFPWAWISLFVDQVHVPCTVFLGDEDALVPARAVEAYFKDKHIPVTDASSVDQEFFEKHGGKAQNGDLQMNTCVFRGHIHGEFTEQPHLISPIVLACNALCAKAEKK